VHVPQTEEARAEARELMAVGANLATPKNGELTVAATQDFLTAAHLLTSRDSWFPRSSFGQLCAHATGGAEAVDLPVPALLKPVERWSGKQLFSVLVSPSAASAAASAAAGCGPSPSPPSSSSYGKSGGGRCGEDGGDSWGSAVAGAPPGCGGGGGGAEGNAATAASSSPSPSSHSDDARRFAAADAAAAVNLCLTERTHASGTGALCPNDGFVLFRDSRLLLGRLGKGTLGGGGKGGLFAALASGAGGAPAAAAAMRRLAALAARWIGERGLSVGIGDVTPAPGLEGAKSAALVEAYARAEAVAEAAALASGAGAGGVKDETSSSPSDQPPESAASRDARAALEAAAAAALNGVREGVSRLCMAGLGRHNAPLLMSQCGAKGSPINIAQMVGCVGQQSVGGARPPDGFRGRALPAFARGDRRPAARGFVASSFYEGLGPAEFFFHAMAGRVSRERSGGGGVEFLSFLGVVLKFFGAFFPFFFFFLFPFPPPLLSFSHLPPRILPACPKNTNNVGGTRRHRGQDGRDGLHVPQADEGPRGPVRRLRRHGAQRGRGRRRAFLRGRRARARHDGGSWVRGRRRGERGHGGAFGLGEAARRSEGREGEEGARGEEERGERGLCCCCSASPAGPAARGALQGRRRGRGGVRHRF